MKWVWSNGLHLIVRDVSPILLKIETLGEVPLPIILPMTIMEDDKAREVVKKIMTNKHYKRTI
jgi:hypothetical protein